MKKQGFTLIELLAVIILLGVIGLIITPIVSNIIKNNKESLYQAQLEEIKASTEKWMWENIDVLPDIENAQITITLLDLKKNGKIGLDVRNPKTDELFPNDMEIVIAYQNNDYKVTVKDDSGTNVTDQLDAFSPIIVMNGNSLEYLEMGEVYEDKGVMAKDRNGNQVNDITIQYLENGKEVASLSSNTFKTYTVVYTAKVINNGNTYTSHVVRTVVVRDTTPPVITVPETVEITLEQAQNYDIMQGVSVTDNSKETISITASTFEKTVGSNIITYQAKDSSGNEVVKKRIIKVTE